MDYPTAFLLLSDQAAYDTYPRLSTSELDALLTATVGYAVWRPETAYEYNTIIQPTQRNGHRYRALRQGISGTDEPFWPLYTAPDSRLGLTRPHWHGYVGPMPGSQVSDGTTVWLEAGPDDESPISPNQVRLATYRAWRRKAAKASADYDATLGNQTSYSRSQVQKQCLAMAKIFTPTEFA